ncbi:MAG: RagB/SusD family nutrient uptake outer membrane protein [Muribaculaceae bacterium]|nr:RagB/SusD family nutrient uptake outer membrane protein [Muribaculaceae bacterium]
MFTDREYFFPIGTNEITTNPAIKQNPGWESK